MIRRSAIVAFQFPLENNNKLLELELRFFSCLFVWQTATSVYSSTHSEFSPTQFISFLLLSMSSLCVSFLSKCIQILFPNSISPLFFFFFFLSFRQIVVATHFIISIPGSREESFLSSRFQERKKRKIVRSWLLGLSRGDE